MKEVSEQNEAANKMEFFDWKSLVLLKLCAKTAQAPLGT